MNFVKKQGDSLKLFKKIVKDERSKIAAAYFERFS